MLLRKLTLRYTFNATSTNTLSEVVVTTKVLTPTGFSLTHKQSYCTELARFCRVYCALKTGDGHIYTLLHMGNRVELHQTLFDAIIIIILASQAIYALQPTVSILTHGLPNNSPTVCKPRYRRGSRDLVFGFPLETV